MTPQRMMERLFPEGHTYKVAFYSEIVELDRYTTEGEWVGAGYTAGGDGLDFRSDLGTLNLSDVPTIMVELGNMRDDADADRMTSPRGRRADAAALARGVERFLGA